MKKFLTTFVLCFAVGTVRAANNCTGATYYDSTNDTCIACPTGYDANTDAGKTDITQCQIHCNAGTWYKPYIQLEYIESTGTQYIDTGIIPTNYNWSAVFTMSASAFSKYFFGAGPGNWNSGAGYQFGIANTTGTSPWGAGRTSTTVNTLDVSANNFYEYKVTKNGVYVNDVLKAPIANPADAPGTLSLYIGRSNNSDGSYNNGSSKWKSVKIYDDNNGLVRDMVPVRKDADGEIGMYDKVTNTFFGNSGTGTFVAGSDMSEHFMGVCIDVGAGYYAGSSTVNYGSIGTRTACPVGTYSAVTNAASCTPCTDATYNDETAAVTCKSCPMGYIHNTIAGKTSVNQCQIHCDGGTWKVGYTELEYIEGTGTQYIDTLYRPSAENVTYDFSIANKNNAYNERHFTYIAGGNIQLFTNNNNLKFYEANPKVNSVIVAQNYNEKINIVLQNNYSAGTLSLLINGSDKTPSVATVRSNAYTKNLFIFSFSNGNYAFKGKMYHYKLYENDVLVRDFVPARRDTDGAIGVYDKVTNTFLGNSGTGTFIAGPIDIINTLGCTNVGPGYYAPASTTNFGSVGTRTACASGLSTVGYGHGADSADDCARTLHIGDNIVYMRQDKVTTPALNIRMENGDVFYVNLSPTNHNMSKLHFWYNGNEYTAYDDSLYYGERDFETGAQITPIGQ